MNIDLPAALALSLWLAAGPAHPAGKPAAKGHAAAKAQVAEVTVTGVALDAKDAPRAVAEQFLGALSRPGADKDLAATLLGGETLVSRIYVVDNWKIVGREKRRVELGDLSAARQALQAFDREHRRALGELVSEAPAPRVGSDVAMGGVSGADAAFSFELVKTRAKALQETNPVLSFLAAVDRWEQPYVYDPLRRLLARAGWTGRYTAELDQFWIETREGHHEDHPARRWPLYVLRLRTARVDSGVKVLPTNDTTGAAASVYSATWRCTSASGSLSSRQSSSATARPTLPSRSPMLPASVRRSATSPTQVAISCSTAWCTWARTNGRSGAMRAPSRGSRRT
jgi:hypothetical protein